MVNFLKWLPLSVMIVKFGTIHNCSSLHGKEKFWSFFVQFFEQIQQLTEHDRKMWHIGLK